MSPTEFELRAALHDGEGEEVSANRIIAHAIEQRRARRVRYGSIAAAAAVVAGIAVTGVVTLGNGNSRDSTSASSAGGASAAQSATLAASAADRAGSVPAPVTALSAPTNAAAQAASGSGSGTTSGSTGGGTVGDTSGGSTTSDACPATRPNIDAPDVGSGSLFSAPVISIRLCLYPETGGSALLRQTDGQPRGGLVSGASANQLVTSVDDAPATEPHVPCPLYLTANGLTLVLIPTSTSGVVLAPIETAYHQNPCGQPITNGVAVRYNWTPPAQFDAILDN